MLIGSKRKFGNKSFNVSLCSESIPSVSNVKYLGVFIDRFLKWDVHINYIIQKMRCRIYMLCRLKPLSSSILLRLYKVYVLPLSDYCCISYQSCSKPLSERLDHTSQGHETINISCPHTKLYTSLTSIHSSKIFYCYSDLQDFKRFSTLVPIIYRSIFRNTFASCPSQ